MIDGASQLSPIARLPVVASRAVSTASTTVPVILRATELEAPGARMRVGGLRVVDRAIRQLGRLRDVRAVVASDGSIPLPRRLPRNMECRELSGDTAAALEALKAELGPETASVGADTVWYQPARFDKGVRIVDAASRRVANEAVYRDLGRDTLGLVDRAINRRISSRITRVLAGLPISSSLVTLIAGFVGLYGALMVAAGTPQSVLQGFAILEGHVILDGCAGELARVRLHRTALAAWLDTVVSDFVSVVLILAVGLALWRHGGTYLDMKIAVTAALLNLFYMAITYRELIVQGESDVLKLRWWFAYGQPIRGVTGAGSQTIKGVILLGRLDVFVLVGLLLVAGDQLPVVLLYGLIIAIVRAAAAFGQLLTPAWRIRPPA
jgi:hypothetical protein